MPYSGQTSHLCRVQVEVEQQKHYPLVLSDPVWRLDMIDKDGEFHKSTSKTLTRNNVHTVQEYLRMLNARLLAEQFVVDDIEDETWMRHTSPEDGNKKKHEMWLVATNHAMKCGPGDKVYTYSGANGTIYVDSVFGRIFKVEIDGVECSRQLLLLDTAKTQRKAPVRQVMQAQDKHQVMNADPRPEGQAAARAPRGPAGSQQVQGTKAQDLSVLNQELRARADDPRLIPE
ncbi:hypothetical protein PR202_gb13544 [Eleusine coracana subsp. coracana]|uniref:Calmodulin binding protein central domain-containing protein n=1 Tax=Eleusine coracana subsp. coracana TaxID=191504 RepID=A0AAV5ESC2_ELECO|nr:hypothetical protein PR202_gb13544 [Eleusine coracana subsp. coracana]